MKVSEVDLSTRIVYLCPCGYCSFCYKTIFIMVLPIFRVQQDATGQHRFHLRSRGNSEIILASEAYTSRAGALNGIDSVRRHAPLEQFYERRTAKDSSPYFVLKAGNHEVIGVSEMYSSAVARDHGIKVVMRDAPVALLDEDGPFTIIVNGRPHVVSQDRLTYLDLVKLAFPNVTPNPREVLTVDYRGGADPAHPQGMLVATSPAIRIKNKMKFNVSRTAQS